MGTKIQTSQKPTHKRQSNESIVKFFKRYKYGEYNYGITKSKYISILTVTILLGKTHLKEN